MSLQANLTQQISWPAFSGSAVQIQVAITGVLELIRQVSVPAALVGTLTTRTNNTDGSVTITGTNTITNGQIVDIYWVLAGVEYCARSATVGTVAGQVVPFTGGTGDALPATSTAVTVAVQQSYDLVFTGSNAVLIAYQTASTGMSNFIFQSAGPTERWYQALAGSGVNNRATPVNPVVGAWFSQSGVANPVSGQSLTKIVMTHADTDAAKVMNVGVMINT